MRVQLSKEEIQEAVQKLKVSRHLRKRAYLQVLGDLNNQSQTAVLADLAKFCRAHKSTHHADPRESARLDGRREVWLRIEHHLKLTSEQFWSLYGRPDLE